MNTARRVELGTETFEGRDFFASDDVSTEGFINTQNESYSPDSIRNTVCPLTGWIIQSSTLHMLDSCKSNKGNVKWQSVAIFVL